MCNNVAGHSVWTCLFSPFLCDQRSQRYIFGARNTITDYPMVLLFRFFIKIMKKEFKKFAHKI